MSYAEGAAHACASANARNVETMVIAERIDARSQRSIAYMPAAVVGSYRILKLIGDGAIGRVYLAEHVKLGKRVALKMLRTEYAANAAVVKRFFAEARSVSKLANENIVDITDFFEDQEGKSYYIMEHLEGRTLRAAINEEGPLPLARIIVICKQIAGALQAAHDAKIVHRDLKPENIFLIDRGERKDFVKLLDFGVAKLLDGRDARLDADTIVETLIGSPPYMAPEQTRGTQVDQRADIYAFGVMLYELVTGKNPFEGPTIQEIIELHRHMDPPPPAFTEKIDARAKTILRSLLERCLRKDPLERPVDMNEVLGELLRIDLRPRGVQRALIAAVAVSAAALIVAGLTFANANKVSEQPAIVIATVPADPQPPPAQVVVTAAAINEAPKVVRLEINSEPSGSQVRRAGSDAVLGVTPFFVDLPYSSEEIALELSKDGYERAAQTFTPERNVALMIQLKQKAAPIKKAAKAVRRAKAPSDLVDPSEQKNPFENK